MIEVLATLFWVAVFIAIGALVWLFLAILFAGPTFPEDDDDANE